MPGIVEDNATNYKINELIEASNRQEDAILEIAGRIEDGSWQNTSKRIADILNGLDL